MRDQKQRVNVRLGDSGDANGSSAASSWRTTERALVSRRGEGRTGEGAVHVRNIVMGAKAPQSCAKPGSFDNGNPTKPVMSARRNNSVMLRAAAMLLQRARTACSCAKETRGHQRFFVFFARRRNKPTACVRALTAITVLINRWTAGKKYCYAATLMHINLN